MVLSTSRFLLSRVCLATSPAPTKEVSKHDVRLSETVTPLSYDLLLRLNPSMLNTLIGEDPTNVKTTCRD